MRGLGAERACGHVSGVSWTQPSHGGAAWQRDEGQRKGLRGEGFGGGGGGARQDWPRPAKAKGEGDREGLAARSSATFGPIPDARPAAVPLPARTDAGVGRCGRRKRSPSRSVCRPHPPGGVRSWARPASLVLKRRGFDSRSTRFSQLKRIGSLQYF